MATRFLLGGRICYTSMELIVARFAYLPRCESFVTSQPGQQVARVITQCPMPGRGTPLLSQFLKEEPGPPGPHPPSSSSSSESDEGGPPGTGLWYEGEWWSYDDIDGNDDGAASGTAGGATGGSGGVYEEGE